VQSEALTSHLITRHPRLSSAQDSASLPTTRVTFGSVKEGDSSITFAAAVPGLTKADIKVARPFLLLRVAASNRVCVMSFVQAYTLCLACAVHDGACLLKQATDTHVPFLQVKMTADKVLVISGQHNSNNETSVDGHTHIHHISSSFTRRYQLPSNTDTDGITAKLENGVLTLHVSKAVTPQMPDKEIHIQSSPAEAANAPSVPAADNVV
jgi:HSP20 family molecular chaperone IbpA